MKLHVLFFHFHQYVRVFALDFVSHVPLQRMPHCDIVRSMTIKKISSANKTFNSVIIFFIVLALRICF